jgi:hypothetical protein
MNSKDSYIAQIKTVFDGVYKCDSDEFGNLCVICADGDDELNVNYGEYWSELCPWWRREHTDGMDDEEIKDWEASVDRKMAFEPLLDYGRRTTYMGSCYNRSLDRASDLSEVRNILAEIIDEQDSGCNSVTERANDRFEQAKKILDEIDAA